MPEAVAFADPERSDQPGAAEEVDPVLVAAERRAERKEANRAGFPVAAQRFADEARDAAWAEPREQTIRGALEGVDPEGVEIHGVECRATLCEIKVRLRRSGPFETARRMAPIQSALGSEYFTGVPPGDPAEQAPRGLTVIYTSGDVGAAQPE